MNRCTIHNNVSSFQNNKVFSVIYTLSMSGPTIIDKNLKDGGSKMTMRVSKVKIVQGSLCVILHQFRLRIKINVEWKR